MTFPQDKFICLSQYFKTDCDIVSLFLHNLTVEGCNRVSLCPLAPRPRACAVQFTDWKAAYSAGRFNMLSHCCVSSVSTACLGGLGRLASRLAGDVMNSRYCPDGQKSMLVRFCGSVISFW